MQKKIFIFLPDGGGLRNFVFSSFKSVGDKLGFDIIYWNGGSFPIKEKFNFKEVKIEDERTHYLTPLYARARKHIELNISSKKFDDSVYQSYKFPFYFNNIKNIIKSNFIKILIAFGSNDIGLEKVKNKIDKLERGTSRYKHCKEQLIKHKPDLIFCSNQRNTKNISSLLAARDLGIKTMCFIQSWDNVPKAMQVVETDYYLVWSELMRVELLKYYPFVKNEQVIVTGTPQFEPHFDTNLLQSREDFFKQYDLDLDKKYICFTGDDETTSPLDQYYLEDLTNVVRNLNSKGENLGVIFRKCPVDKTNRYDKVLDANTDIIKVLDPIWNQINNRGEVLPTIEDSKMLFNVCEYSEFVTNVCSSTVFDFVGHKKSCIYFNYEQPQLKKGIRDIGQNYKYVHFRSMPSKKAVVFCNDRSDLEDIVLKVLTGKVSNVNEGLKWFEIIAGKTPANSTLNIWNALDKILK